jgi:hypothetical protein
LSIETTFADKYRYDSAKEYREPVIKLLKRKTGLDISVKFKLEPVIKQPPQEKNEILHNEAPKLPLSDTEEEESAKIKAPSNIEKIAKDFGGSVVKK